VLRHLPNLLTLLRLLAAPLTAFLVLHGLDKAALGVFVFAGLSDAADGYLAKRLAPGSRVGAYLDPAADKLLMLASFVTLTVVQAAPLWLTAVVIGRDVAILAGLLLAHLLSLPVRIEPLPIGKVSTAVQVSYVGLMLIFLAFGIEVPQVVLTSLVVTTAVFTVASWLGYAQVLAVALGRKTA